MNPSTPPVPAEGLPPGWSMEQWYAYGAKWIEQEARKAAEATAKSVPAGPPNFSESVQPEPITPPMSNVPSGPPNFSNPVLEPEPIYPSDVPYGQPIVPLQGNYVPTGPPVYNEPMMGSMQPQFSQQPLPNYGSIYSPPPRRKGLVIGGSIVATIIVLSLTLALMPPGVIPMMDEMRDRDDDGLTDAEELDLGTSPNKADTDGDGLLDPDEECPAGIEDWESTYSSDYDSDGCKDSNEDIDDDDDGIVDGEDECPRGRLDWTSSSSNDFDGDGCKDSVEDDDDDDDGWSDSLESDCETDSKNRYEKPLDWDEDGVCDYLDEDDDNDGCLDWNDEFPLDASECLDTDNDGIGNNEDLDDDNDGYSDILENSCMSNSFDRWDWPSDFDEDGECDNLDTDDDDDGVLDGYDVNDRADTGILLTLDSFKAIEKMDYWDNEAEIYICVYLDDASVGCGPDGDYIWPMTTGTTYTINYEFFLDLPETQRFHHFKITAWDNDGIEDDRMDINPDSGWDSYTFNYDSLYGTIDESTYASGTGDGNGYDGALWFSYEEKDLRTQRQSQFSWEYDSQTFYYSTTFDYSTYKYYKNLNHSTPEWEDFKRFSTPHVSYIDDLANDLLSKANSNGYTSELEIANFISAFVGAIQYERYGWVGGN